MQSVTKPQTTLEGVLSNNNYPSSIDNMVGSTTTSQGTDTSLPPSATNPVFGADGKLPVTKISKIQG